MKEDDLKDLERFQNRLRILSSINGAEVLPNQDFVNRSYEIGREARSFNTDPYRYLRSADIATASAIWEAVLKREAMR